MAKNGIYLSLSQAAKETGKSKSVISKALKDGTISHNGKGSNGYKIEPAELFRVFPQNAVLKMDSDRSSTPIERAKNDLENSYKIRELEFELQVKDQTITSREKEIEKAETQIEDLRKDRDSWRNQAETLALPDLTGNKSSQIDAQGDNDNLGGRGAATSVKAMQRQNFAVYGTICLLFVCMSLAAWMFWPEIESRISGKSLTYDKIEPAAGKTDQPYFTPIP